MNSRSSRIRPTVAALALALALFTALPVIGAEQAPPPRLGDPVVVERTPESSAITPTRGPYEKDGGPERSSPPAVTRSPVDDDVPDGPVATPTPDAAHRRAAAGAQPVPPESPLPATTPGTGGPTTTSAVTPPSSTVDDDGDDDDGGGDNGGDDG